MLVNAKVTDTIFAFIKNVKGSAAFYPANAKVTDTNFANLYQKCPLASLDKYSQYVYNIIIILYDKVYSIIILFGGISWSKN